MKDRPQVYISGALHGDERVGPVASYYLIEYLVTNFNKDPQITFLLRNREIIITPMTNAYGYHYKTRKEKIGEGSEKQGQYFDINRDFPYNQDPEACMNTIAGRVIYRIFADNLIVSSITFHGGTNVIGYPWGSLNHMRNDKQIVEAPDFVSLESMGRVMQEEAGGRISSKGISKYVLGDMTSTVYAVRGGMEDWGYGAGWDSEPGAAIYKCTPVTYPIDDDFFGYDNGNIRSAVYLVETDDVKSPNESTFGCRDISDDEG